MDYPDGYVEVTGMMSLQQRQYYCLTLCYRSITTGELKQLKLRSLQLVEENVNKLSRARTVPASRRVCARQTAGWRLRHLAAFQTERSGLCAPRLPHHADHRDGTRRLASATLAHRLRTCWSLPSTTAFGLCLHRVGRHLTKNRNANRLICVKC